MLLRFLSAERWGPAVQRTCLSLIPRASYLPAQFLCRAGARQVPAWFRVVPQSHGRGDWTTHAIAHIEQPPRQILWRSDHRSTGQFFRTAAERILPLRLL